MSVLYKCEAEVILQFKLQLNYPIVDNQQPFFGCSSLKQAIHVVKWEHQSRNSNSKMFSSLYNIGL